MITVAGTTTTTTGTLLAARVGSVSSRSLLVTPTLAFTFGTTHAASATNYWSSLSIIIIIGHYYYSHSKVVTLLFTRKKVVTLFTQSLLLPLSLSSHD
jgi:hypothetical protein